MGNDKRQLAQVRHPPAAQEPHAGANRLGNGRNPAQAEVKAEEAMKDLLSAVGSPVFLHGKAGDLVCQTALTVCRMAAMRPASTQRPCIGTSNLISRNTPWITDFTGRL